MRGGATVPEGAEEWSDALDSVPPEVAPIESLVRGCYVGRTNYAGWYFRTRLPLDLAAVGGASIPEDGYGADAGLAAFHGASIDAPILAVSAGLVPMARYEAVRTRVAATLGAGRVLEGLDRDDARAFDIVDATQQTHLDPVIADERTLDNPVPAAVIAFLQAHTRTGGVSVTP